MRDRNMHYSIIIALLFLAVGFAAITTTIVLNSTSSVGIGDFDVRFSSVSTDVGGEALISNDGKSISFTSKELKSINDTVVLNYVITNYSNQYDADLDISVEVLDHSYDDYYTMSNICDEFIEARDSVDGTLTIRLVQSSIEDISVDFRITINASAVERESLVDSVYVNQSGVISYLDSTQSYSNPDRGFYKDITLSLVADSNNNVTGFENLDAFTSYSQRADNATNGLYHVKIDLSLLSGNVNPSGNDSLVTQDILDDFDYIMSTVEASGKTVVLRFTYDIDGLGNREPKSWSTIENHIVSFASVINKYKNCITTVDAGFLGKWAEMHSAGVYQSEEYYYQLLDLLINNLDEDIKIGVRRPLHYQIYYGSLDLSLDTKHRFAIYDDGMYGSETDIGTIDRGTRNEFISWIGQMAEYSFFGGEATIDSSGSDADKAYSNAERVLPEMYQQHLAYINKDYNLDIINTKWDNTTYTSDDEYNGLTYKKFIEDHLGYRLVIRDSLLSNIVTKGGSVDFILSLENTGFGNIIHQYDMSLIIRKGNIYYEAPLYYDIRDIKSTNTETLFFSYDLPNDLATGEWEAYVRVHRRGNQNINIRFANANVWNEGLKANLIGKFTVDEGSSSNTSFKQKYVNDAEEGESHTYVEPIDPASIIRVSYAIIDEDDHSNEIDYSYFNAIKGQSYDFSDSDTFSSLGINIPDGWFYLAIRSSITGWDDADIITMPDQDTLYIEIYVYQPPGFKSSH